MDFANLVMDGVLVASALVYSLSRTRQQRDMCCFLDHARTRVGGVVWDDKRKCESRRNPSCTGSGTGARS